MADTETDLSESLDSLRYLVAVPGAFAASYPDTTDEMLTTLMADGFAEAQLFGLFATYEVDEDGVVTPGLTRAEIALVALLAAIRLMSVTMMGINTSVTYRAGSAEYSTQQSANVLRDILGGLIAQRKAIIDALLAGAGAKSAFYMADQYLVRQFDDAALSGW